MLMYEWLLAATIEKAYEKMELTETYQKSSPRDTNAFKLLCCILHMADTKKSYEIQIHVKN